MQVTGDIFVLSRVSHDWDDEKTELQIDGIINIDSGTSAIICKKENVTSYEVERYKLERGFYV